MSEPYDVLIIGSGPGGYVAAVRAGQLGLRTAIVEKDTRLGGTCLLRGCIPTKAMLKSAELADQARKADEFGVSVGEVSVDIEKVLKRKNKVVAQNAGGVAYLMKKNKVDVHAGFGRLLGARGGVHRVEVKPEGGEAALLTAKHVILATGSRPRTLPGVEVDGERVLTSDEILDLAVMPEHLLVLGGGAVGAEFASVYHSFGCKVTLVELAERLLPIEDAEVGAEFAKAYGRRGIKVHTATRLSQVERVGDKVRARLEPVAGGQAQSVSASHLLVAIGRAPCTEGVGLENTQARVERGFVHVDEFGRTDEPGLYAIGDILAGKPQLAHAASAEAVLAVEHIAGLEVHPIDFDHIPGCTYATPEVGSLGLTEAQARERGYDVKVGRFPFSASGKAKVIGDSTGFVKIVAEAKYHQILGVHIIGAHATELIAEAGPLLRLESTVEELMATVHAHPTLSEAVHEAAHAVFGQALHL